MRFFDDQHVRTAVFHVELLQRPYTRQQEALAFLGSEVFSDHSVA